jgi:hypothetical protein
VLRRFRLIPHTGVKSMKKQSENKATKTDTIDKSKQPSAAPTKAVKDELSEQELEKASGGHGKGTTIEIDG